MLDSTTKEKCKYNACFRIALSIGNSVVEATET